ncbi:MAG TPA: hypothetical protein VG917_06065 [Patescibacteria group bacterium]|nr:hypothetical protein [Patescibacteria group bacterium]
MATPKEAFERAYLDHVTKTVSVNAIMAMRLSEHFSRDNIEREVGRKPSDASLGAAAFVLGLDYYTYKSQQSALSGAKKFGITTEVAATFLNQDSSWAVTMRSGGIDNNPETEVSFKSFIEEPTGSKQGSIANTEKLASYTNFFSDIITLSPIIDKYSHALGLQETPDGRLIPIVYGPHMFVNIQAMGLAAISVHPGGVNDSLFKDIPDQLIRNGAIKEGKAFLQKMQLFRTLLRNSLLNQKEESALTHAISKSLLSEVDNKRMATVDVIAGLQSIEDINAMLENLNALKEKGINPEFNELLSSAIQEYVARHIHLG